MKLKIFLLALVCSLGLQSVNAGNDRPIEVSQLPKEAQHFIKANFNNQKVALAKMETGLFERSYDVIFANGDKVEFNRNGRWTEIDLKRGAIPAKLIPSKIRHYVSKHYDGVTIHQINRENANTEVELSNGLELNFDKKMRLIGVDD